MLFDDSPSLILESLTAPHYKLYEIKDLQTTTVAQLKDAASLCMNLAAWIKRTHISLLYNGVPLGCDDKVLSEYAIRQGSQINYVIMIA